MDWLRNRLDTIRNLVVVGDVDTGSASPTKQRPVGTQPDAPADVRRSIWTQSPYLLLFVGVEKAVGRLVETMQSGGCQATGGAMAGTESGKVHSKGATLSGDVPEK